VLACNAFFTRVDRANVKLKNFISFEETAAIGEV
jgi:hypothetical protein